jgi:hypothetical protein
VDELKSSGKSFEISKWEVWGAWEKVKANKGAPGVDGCSVEEFAKDLRSNLYKIWNRVHSGVGGELRFQAARTGSQGLPARARVMASRAVSPWLVAVSR